jgi:hypothetical protein
MVEPDNDARIRALIVNSWEARDVLGVAERYHDTNGEKDGYLPTVIEWLRQVRGLLGACKPLAVASGASGDAQEEIFDLVDKATLMTGVALAHAKLSQSYKLRFVIATPNLKLKRSEKEKGRISSRTQHAIIGARQETHRLITALAEAYPDHYDTE